MEDDLDMIRRVLEGDRESYRRLVERYAGPVTQMIRNVTGDDQTEGRGHLAPAFPFLRPLSLLSAPPRCSVRPSP